MPAASGDNTAKSRCTCTGNYLRRLHCDPAESSRRSKTDMTAASFSTTRLKAASSSVINANAAGFNATHLKAAAASKTDRKSDGFNATQLQAAGLARPTDSSKLQLDPSESRKLQRDRSRCSRLQCDPPEAAGAFKTDLKTAGFSTIQLKAASVARPI